VPGAVPVPGRAPPLVGPSPDGVAAGFRLVADTSGVGTVMVCCSHPVTGPENSRNPRAAAAAAGKTPRGRLRCVRVECACCAVGQGSPFWLMMGPVGAADRGLVCKASS